MISTSVKIVLAFVWTLLLFSCDSNKVFEKYVEVENATWEKGEILRFEFEALDTTLAHNLYVNITNTGNYPYSNLYLFLEMHGPDGGVLRDTVNCILANKRGKWLGKGIGDLWDLKIPYVGGFKFAQIGTFSVSLEQAMREDVGLKGVTDVGLRVEKVRN